MVSKKCFFFFFGHLNQTCILYGIKMAKAPKNSEEKEWHWKQYRKVKISTDNFLKFVFKIQIYS